MRFCVQTGKYPLFDILFNVRVGQSSKVYLVLFNGTIIFKVSLYVPFYIRYSRSFPDPRVLEQERREPALPHAPD